MAFDRLANVLDEPIVGPRKGKNTVSYTVCAKPAALGVTKNLKCHFSLFDIEWLKIIRLIINTLLRII